MSHICDETYKIYREKNQKARKAYRCSACRETIEQGHVYTYVACIHDGGFTRYRRCLRCQKLHEHLRELCGHLKYDDVWPDEQLNCGLSYEDEWGDLPADIAALAFKSGKDLQPGVVDAL